MDLHIKDYENEENFIWRLGQAKDSGEIDLSWSEIADIINYELGNEDKPFSEAAFRKPYQYAKKFYDAGVFNKNSDYNVNKLYNTETSINKDGTYSSKKLIEMNERESKDPIFILNAHGFDDECWEIVSLRNNVRQVNSKENGIVTLYASYLTVKPISEKLPLSKIENFFNSLDRNCFIPVLDYNYSYLNGDKLLLIDIADLHMNLQSSILTSGVEYNCKIAEDLFFYVIEDILTRTKNYNFNEIIFCIGGDMLNSDNLSGTTTKGTPQTNDISLFDAYELLCSITVKAIELLKQNCSISVIYIKGNHDEISGFKLAKFLDAWFRNDDMVTVDYKPVPRKYRVFGKTLLCFAHDGNIKKLPALIANEAREYWSDVETVEVFLQHLHSEQVLLEENNIRIQRLPTISAGSKWSVDKGYSSKRQCKTFIFDLDDGLTDILYTPIKK